MRVILKMTFIFLFLSFLIVGTTPSFAWEHGHRHWHGGTYVGVNFGVWPDRYYYGYPYYAPYYPYGYPYTDTYYPGYTVVPSSSYQPVVINGTTYYVNNGVYYIYTQYGYQAVATPAGAAAPVVQTTTVNEAPAAGDDAITINVPNNKGSYTAVVLKKSGNGYVGPQGEFYAEFPKVSQLQTMYGK